MSPSTTNTLEQFLSAVALWPSEARGRLCRWVVWETLNALTAEPNPFRGEVVARGVEIEESAASEGGTLVRVTFLASAEQVEGQRPPEELVRQLNGLGQIIWRIAFHRAASPATEQAARTRWKTAVESRNRGLWNDRLAGAGDDMRELCAALCGLDPHAAQNAEEGAGENLESLLRRLRKQNGKPAPLVLGETKSSVPWKKLVWVPVLVLVIAGGFFGLKMSKSQKVVQNPPPSTTNPSPRTNPVVTPPLSPSLPEQDPKLAKALNEATDSLGKTTNQRVDKASEFLRAAEGAIKPWQNLDPKFLVQAQSIALFNIRANIADTNKALSTRKTALTNFVQRLANGAIGTNSTQLSDSLSSLKRDHLRLGLDAQLVQDWERRVKEIEQSIQNVARRELSDEVNLKLALTVDELKNQLATNVTTWSTGVDKALGTLKQIQQDANRQFFTNIADLALKWHGFGLTNRDARGLLQAYATNANTLAMEGADKGVAYASNFVGNTALKPFAAKALDALLKRKGTLDDEGRKMVSQAQKQELEKFQAALGTFERKADAFRLSIDKTPMRKLLETQTSHLNDIKNWRTNRLSQDQNKSLDHVTNLLDLGNNKDFVRRSTALASFRKLIETPVPTDETNIIQFSRDLRTRFEALGIDKQDVQSGFTNKSYELENQLNVFFTQPRAYFSQTLAMLRTNLFYLGSNTLETITGTNEVAIRNLATNRFRSEFSATVDNINNALDLARALAELDRQKVEPGKEPVGLATINARLAALHPTLPVPGLINWASVLKNRAKQPVDSKDEIALIEELPDLKFVRINFPAVPRYGLDRESLWVSKTYLRGDHLSKLKIDAFSQTPGFVNVIKPEFSSGLLSNILSRCTIRGGRSAAEIIRSVHLYWLRRQPDGLKKLDFRESESPYELVRVGAGSKLGFYILDKGNLQNEYESPGSRSLGTVPKDVPITDVPFRLCIRINE